MTKHPTSGGNGDEKLGGEKKGNSVGDNEKKRKGRKGTKKTNHRGCVHKQDGKKPTRPQGRRSSKADCNTGFKGEKSGPYHVLTPKAKNKPEQR